MGDKHFFFQVDITIPLGLFPLTYFCKYIYVGSAIVDRTLKSAFMELVSTLRYETQ